MENNDLGLCWEIAFEWMPQNHDDVIKWKHFPRYWPFVRGIHWLKGQWRGALMFSSICAWIKVWVSNLEASDLTRHRAHYDVTVMIPVRVVNISSGNGFVPSGKRWSRSMSPYEITMGKIMLNAEYSIHNFNWMNHQRSHRFSVWTA